MEALLKGGAGVGPEDKYSGYTPLHRAAGRGHVAMVEVLLKAGAEADPKSNDGDTPLHCAAREGHVAVAEALLKAGAEVDQKVNNGYTPLHRAAGEGHVAMVEVLLKAGAEVEVEDGLSGAPRASRVPRAHHVSLDALQLSG